MKALVGTTFLLLLSLQARAEELQQSEPGPINSEKFNELIGSNSKSESDINDELAKSYQAATETSHEESIKADAKTAIDLVDAEMHQMKDSPVARSDKPVTDRRPNSVEEPRVAVLPAEPKVVLIPVPRAE